MYTIKKTPNDFMVDEQLSIDDIKSGNQFIYRLTKTNLTTDQALGDVSHRFQIPLKQIGFCGNKDKRAITSQYISLPKRIKPTTFTNIKLNFISANKARLHLGAHQGNRFKIIVEGLEDNNHNQPEFFANYFGPQRFSSNNVSIGKAILQGHFKYACRLIDDGTSKNLPEKTISSH